MDFMRIGMKVEELRVVVLENFLERRWRIEGRRRVEAAELVPSVEGKRNQSAFRHGRLCYWGLLRGVEHLRFHYGLQILRIDRPETESNCTARPCGLGGRLPYPVSSADLRSHGPGNASIACARFSSGNPVSPTNVGTKSR